MSKKQVLLSLTSLVVTALLGSPCAAQVIYVRDARGDMRAVVIPQRATFSMGFQGTAVVSPDHMFVRVNVSPFNVQMPDPSTTTFLVMPQRPMSTFSNGILQPPTVALKPLVIPIQGQGFGSGAGGFGGSPFGLFGSSTQFGFSRPGAFGVMSTWSSFDPYANNWSTMWPSLSQSASIWSSGPLASNPWVLPDIDP